MSEGTQDFKKEGVLESYTLYLERYIKIKKKIKKNKNIIIKYKWQ